ncbi:hypothetical protein H9Q72_002066 [Fusarium xylarioides]|uniref:NACHT domain-containing protein n=1 Tax=Fusarium xylarioides TaxID=221167 RepID=A0A9P7I2H1_9HYPO|nr:hypothetical protein H9Q72_002066 [Fusarium xylarioides]
MTSVGDIIAIVQATAQAVEMMRSIRHAEEEKRRLQEQIILLMGTLRTIQAAFNQLPGSNQDAFQNISNQIESYMKDLKQKVSSERKRREFSLSSLMWPMNKNGVDEAFRKISELRQDLILLMQTQDLTGLVARKYQDLVDKLTPEFESSLGRIPDRVDHLAPGTLEWVKSDERYRKWGESNDGLLWVHGMQGAGKTGMAVYIGDELRKEAGMPELFHVARVFCDHQTLNDPKLYKPYMEIVMSIWAQLVKSMGGLRLDPRTLRDWEFQLSCLQLLPSDEQIKFKTDVLKRTVADAGRTVLIVDGLDEIPSLDGQQRLVKCLRDVQRSNRQCRLLITSRPHGDIADLFRNDPQFELEATPHDIELAIHDRISHTGKAFLKRPHITQLVIKGLREKCDGSMLMVKLHMDEVLKSENQHQCEFIIKNLRKTPGEAYKTGLQRMCEGFTSFDGLPETPIQALFWVAFAKAPMTDRQLRQALEIKITDKAYNSTNEKSRSVDVLCGGLLRVEPESGIVRVAHKTVTDYLTSPEAVREHFSTISQHIPRILMRYLGLDDMKIPLLDADSTDRFREAHPLLPYALMYWGEGLSEILGEVERDSAIWIETEEFLRSSHEDWNDYVQAQATQTFATGRGTAIPDDATSPGRFGGLHWAVTFSLRPFIQILHDQNILSSLQDLVPLTPLGLAAALNLPEMAKELLRAGESANGEERYGLIRRPPLFDAVSFWRDDIGSLLLQSGADWSLPRTDNDLSPIDGLYSGGGLLSLFLKSVSGRSPLTTKELQLLVRGAFVTEIRRAIGEGLDINIPCGNGKLALDYARELGKKELIDLLVVHGANSNLKWPGLKSESSGYRHNFDESESYKTSKRIVSERFWGEHRCVIAECSGNTGTNYECVVEPDPGMQSSYETESGSGNESEQTDQGSCQTGPKENSAPEEESEDTDEDSNCDRNTNTCLLLEVPVDERIKLPVQAIVFETNSKDQGWSSARDYKGTYIGGERSWFDMRMCYGEERSQIYRIQHNVHASDRFRMHTNIWDWKELDISAPQRARSIEELRHGSKLQIFARF